MGVLWIVTEIVFPAIASRLTFRSVVSKATDLIGIAARV
jgi:hypothetical protein